MPSFITAVVMVRVKMSIFKNFFKVFQSPHVTVTLGEGHSNRNGLKGLFTKYHCAKFYALVTIMSEKMLTFKFLVRMSGLCQQSEAMQ